MLRRLYHEQPESFAFTPANQEWAEAQIRKYPEGRQASAVIPLLWRAQEQEGWLSKPAIEGVAEMLDLAYIRVLEVATFYFMFQLQPVGSVAHIQVCGTTSCMICGAEDLMAVCKDKIAPEAHQLSGDGKFSWEEVECLGSCSNAPMAQIGKDYYEDLTTESFGKILDDLAAGNVPVPGPQNGRYASEPKDNLTSLTEYEKDKMPDNASVALAKEIGDTIKRIDGTEVPLVTPWIKAETDPDAAPTPDPVPTSGPVPADHARPEEPVPTEDAPVSDEAANEPDGANEMPEDLPDDVPGDLPTEPESGDAKDEDLLAGIDESEPQTLSAPRDGAEPDDLKLINGVGPKLEEMLNELGFYHFDQIAAWSMNEIAWVDNRLKFKGRILRDDWVAQAEALAADKNGA
ncbi:NADH-quinone oxidoreductase subunit E [Chachezhania antarctica]|uniref:NADH-quinone oxidoreductase subunit E n=1 Tax=Chachezhania antarctica TaxID=2340860 RepID=UPI000EB09F8C|nr:NADH-quinone oxidoreductase subunit E [Chachezhania antarctica]|tara:strand:- start:658 stop:1866 length:1209 start_codon:yes stop_codon:yes gene_type:complete